MDIEFRSNREECQSECDTWWQSALYSDAPSRIHCACRPQRVECSFWICWLVQSLDYCKQRVFQSVDLKSSILKRWRHWDLLVEQEAALVSRWTSLVRTWALYDQEHKPNTAMRQRMRNLHGQMVLLFPPLSSSLEHIHRYNWSYKHGSHQNHVCRSVSRTGLLLWSWQFDV